MADDEDGVGAALSDAHCVREAGAAAVAGAARASGLGRETLVHVCLLTKGRDEIWGSALHSLESNFQFEFT